jgi:hypothetical protein
MRGMRDVLFYLQVIAAAQRCVVKMKLISHVFFQRVNPWQYNASYETSVRPQVTAEDDRSSTLSKSRRQIVAEGAAVALPVQWDDCASAAGAPSPPSFTSAFSSSFFAVSAQSTATYCLP